MNQDRRHFFRGKVKGKALIYVDQVEATELMDMSLGGMKVSGKCSLPAAKSVWVEFTLTRSNNEMLFGKRARAKLTYSKFDEDSRRFVMGFQFLSLTEFQHHFIANALSGYL